jgi:Fe-S oxidoreductase
MAVKYTFYTEPFEETGRPGRFLEAMAAILRHSNYGFLLDIYAKTGVRCSRCSVDCQIYQTSRDPRDIPCARSRLILDIYRRYFTPAGKWRARLFGGFRLTDEYIDDMAERLYNCTACRRCKMSCPMGIDHGLITHLSRWILAEIDIIPKALLVSVREQLEGKTKNTSAIPLPALKDTCEFLEEELMETFNLPIKFPLDVEGSEYVFFPAVSDYLLEPDTLMGNAAVFYATNGSWTIGSQYYDGINYGLFYSDRMWDRIVKMEVAEVQRLKGKKILIGECGHASRSAKVGVPNFCGPDGPEVVNIMEYTSGCSRRASSGSGKMSSKSASPTTIPATSPGPAGSSISLARCFGSSARTTWTCTPWVRTTTVAAAAVVPSRSTRFESTGP